MSFPATPLRARDEDHLSSHEIRTLVILERIGGSVSLASVLLIFVAYGLVHRARNVQNTFIVFASVSNIGASIGSIIAYDGLAKGKATALCQAQSFLFEMFMQSDPWWSLAMAVNVFLVFYFHTNPDSFRKFWWLYCIICYGGPFLIALSLLLVRGSGPNRVYGGATIWCWVDRKWDFIRIYTYYMLIWICIVGSILCYFLVGYHVFRTRNQLRSFSTSKTREQKELDNARVEMAQQGFYGTVITEVQVVHSAALPTKPESAHLPSSTTAATTTAQTSSRYPFESASAPDLAEISRNQFYSSVTTSTPRHPPQPSLWSRSVRAIRSLTNQFHVSDPIKRAYLRTSFLFAISVLVTWIPSSLNRIHSWRFKESPYPFHVATAAVLPLQGLWNGIIFFVTSWRALRRWWQNGGAQDDEAAMNEDVAINGRRSGPNDVLDTSDLEDMDSATIGSDAGLRRAMNAAHNKVSPSL
ncbi:Cyclic AMP receptor-like protein A [Escovopsis weberi]|uniref:Cyclic AMP receptor-like protein A n=1 Tax=Escovopsis weberi TaxID=150374 RepID=A0A0M8N9K7_ESCWE|nr:Cyclic AMP receptor-like protein A [Escovopsis weberi]